MIYCISVSEINSQKAVRNSFANRILSKQDHGIRLEKITTETAWNVCIYSEIDIDIDIIRVELSGDIVRSEVSC